MVREPCRYFKRDNDTGVDERTGIGAWVADDWCCTRRPGVSGARSDEHSNKQPGSSAATYGELSRRARHRVSRLCSAVVVTQCPPNAWRSPASSGSRSLLDVLTRVAHNVRRRSPAGLVQRLVRQHARRAAKTYAGHRMKSGSARRARRPGRQANLVARGLISARDERRKR